MDILLDCKVDHRTWNVSSAPRVRSLAADNPWRRVTWSWFLVGFFKVRMMLLSAGWYCTRKAMDFALRPGAFLPLIRFRPRAFSARPWSDPGKRRYCFLMIPPLLVRSSRRRVKTRHDPDSGRRVGG